MTNHRHGGDQGSDAGKFDRADYPALQEMLPGYLHQDFGAEYGSAGAAAKAFVADASGDEILSVREEWVRLTKALDGRGIGAWQAALRDLGSAWYPASDAEVREVGEILASAEA